MDSLEPWQVKVRKPCEISTYTRDILRQCNTHLVFRIKRTEWHNTTSFCLRFTIHVIKIRSEETPSTYYYFLLSRYRCLMFWWMGRNRNSFKNHFICVICMQIPPWLVCEVYSSNEHRDNFFFDSADPCLRPSWKTFFRYVLALQTSPLIIKTIIKLCVLNKLVS